MCWRSAAIGRNFVAWLLLSDTVKPEAAAAMTELRTLGLNRQLTGDRQSVAHALARAIGITDIEVRPYP